jgi:hypothetical protein
MARFQVSETWVNTRIYEVDADTADAATGLVLSGFGVEVDDRCDGYEVDAIEIVNGKAVTMLDGGR